MEKLTKEQFFAHLDTLTILELSDYIKEFETRYGISAAAAAPVMMASPLQKLLRTLQAPLGNVGILLGELKKTKTT